MKFVKLAFGALLVSVGGLLLAIRLGFAPPDSLAVLLPYWPLLLVAFGLAFLASATKNVFLGALAPTLILGGVAFGAFWTAQRHAKGETSHFSHSIDLRGKRVGALTVRTRTLAGNFTLEAGADTARSLEVELRHVAGKPGERQRWIEAGGSGIYEWPVRGGVLDMPPPGANLTIHVPRRVPLRLECGAQMSAMRADLTRLRPERCDLKTFASSLRLALGSGGPPSRIRIESHFSSARILLPANCPVRLDFGSRWNTISVPEDFVELAPGRSKGRAFTSEGRGNMLEIRVEGELNNVRVERLQASAV